MAPQGLQAEWQEVAAEAEDGPDRRYSRADSTATLSGFMTEGRDSRASSVASLSGFMMDRRDTRASSMAPQGLQAEWQAMAAEIQDNNGEVQETEGQSEVPAEAEAKAPEGNVSGKVSLIERGGGDLAVGAQPAGRWPNTTPKAREPIPYLRLKSVVSLLNDTIGYFESMTINIGWNKHSTDFFPSAIYGTDITGRSLHPIGSP